MKRPRTPYVPPLPDAPPVTQLDVDLDAPIAGSGVRGSYPGDRNLREPQYACDIGEPTPSCKCGGCTRRRAAEERERRAGRPPRHGISPGP